MTGYRALAVLAERELQLVAAGSFDELPALRAERAALVEALPDTPPATAGPALERAATVQALIDEVLAESMREAGAALQKLSRGRTAMHGYAPAAEQPKLVDHAG